MKSSLDMSPSCSSKVALWQAVLACLCFATFVHFSRIGTTLRPVDVEIVRAPSAESALTEQPPTVEDKTEPSPSVADSTEQSSPAENDLKSRLQQQVIAAFPPSLVPTDQIPGNHMHDLWLKMHRNGDLPTLPPDRSPFSDTWDNSVSICACMLQENTTDVREWLMYHRWLGVDHVYLTENSDPPPQHLVEQLQDFVDDGFLTLEYDGFKANQHNIYKRCMEKYRHTTNWMTFIDIDEFIVMRKEGVTLKEFLNGFRYQAGLVVQWLMMGSSGREHRPQTGGVLAHYDRCDKKVDPFVKSIVNTWFLANHGGNVHNFEYRHNMLAVDEHNRTMPKRWPLPDACDDGTVPDPAEDIQCRAVPAFEQSKNYPMSFDIIALHHYVLKSKEDYAIKMARGGGDTFDRKEKYFTKIDKRAQGTGGICEEAIKLAAECCPEDQLTI